jgi:acyl phosphate:glycerol-3-phosphate acyltransferase
MSNVLVDSMWFPVLCAYLIGTFPSGKIIAKAHGVDITKTGSGNVGATNLARSLGKKAGVLTLLIDTLKGFVTPALVAWIGYSWENTLASGVAVVAGHCFSIPGVLRGGKGVATSLGAFLYIGTIPTLSGLLLFLLLAKQTKLISLASVLGVGCTPFVAALLGMQVGTIVAFSLVSMIVTIRHADNIKRLLKGTENKFSSARTTPSVNAGGPQC